MKLIGRRKPDDFLTFFFLLQKTSVLKRKKTTKKLISSIGVYVSAHPNVSIAGVLLKPYSLFVVVRSLISNYVLGSAVVWD